MDVRTAEEVGLFGSRLTVRTRDGRTLYAESDSHRPRRKLSADEQVSALHQKFDGLVGPVLGSDATARLRRLLTDLPGHGSIADLVRATIPGDGTSPA